jgi:catechol 2,3-dioxygenase-like lactoylglutathione lyase family enzyme
MTVKFQVTIDCADPNVLVRFWADALGYRIEPPPDGFETWAGFYRSIGVPEEEIEDIGENGSDRLVDPDGHGPRFWFQKVPESKIVKNRLHLDLLVGGGRRKPIEQRRASVDAEAERLVAAGATRLRVLHEEGLDHYAVVMQDPEGNEFCLV